MRNVTKLAILSRDRSNQSCRTSLDVGTAFSDSDCICESISRLEVDELQIYYWANAIVSYKGILDTTRHHAFKITPILTQVVKVDPVLPIGRYIKGRRFTYKQPCGIEGSEA